MRQLEKSRRLLNGTHHSQWVQDVCLLRKKHSDSSSDYLQAVVRSSMVLKQLVNFMVGSTFKRVNVEQIRNLIVPMPLPEEQTAIATVLSDIDSLITSLGRLIAKKRDIKQAAMQQLLTGKMRLPGFSGEWSTKYLRDISFMKGRIGWQGLKQSEFTMNADEPYLITGMNFKNGKIRWDEVYHVSNERYEIAKDIQLESNDILMTKDGTIGKLLFVDIIPFPGKATLNSH